MQGFWFGLIAVLWAGYFVLEGFDYGVGLLTPFVGRTSDERSIALRSIGPVWDGNEVWLIVAGGATFAAFPEWYASMFSGFYLAFALLLGGLIVRGVGIEYRGHVETERGRRLCELGVLVGSFLPALLLGVAFANFLRGVKMTSSHEMVSGFFTLLNPYALLGGLTTLSLFAFHGATFLAFRTIGDVAERSFVLARVLGPAACALSFAFVVWTAFVRGGAFSVVLGMAIVLLLAAAAVAAWAGRELPAFAATAAAAAALPVWTFVALWPNVLPARNNSAFSLTVHNASSSPHTLAVMTGVAVVCVPIVLAYQAWTYWVFRARVTGALAAGHGYGPAPARMQNIADRAGASARETLGLTKPDTPPDTLA